MAGLAWAWLLALLLTLVEASSPLAPEKPLTTTLSLWGFWQPQPCPPHLHHTWGHLHGFQNAIRPGFLLAAGPAAVHHTSPLAEGSVLMGPVLPCLGLAGVVSTESK